MTEQSRVNAGIPAGGQFASHDRAEAATTLGEPNVDDERRPTLDPLPYEGPEGMRCSDAATASLFGYVWAPRRKQYDKPADIAQSPQEAVAQAIADYKAAELVRQDAGRAMGAADAAALAARAAFRAASDAEDQALFALKRAEDAARV